MLTISKDSRAQVENELFQRGDSYQLDSVEVNGHRYILRRLTVSEYCDISALLYLYQRPTQDNRPTPKERAKALAEAYALAFIYSVVDPDTRGNIWALTDIDKITTIATHEEIEAVAGKVLKVNRVDLDEKKRL